MIGWWLIPTAITIAVFSLSIWRLSTVKSAGDFGLIGVYLAAMVMLVLDIIISLTAWLVYFIIV